MDVDANGKEATSTSVDIVVDDMPFLVDSVVSALGGFDRGVRSIVHPQMNVTRTVTGELVDVLTDPSSEVPDDVALIRESWMHLEIDRLPEAALVEELGGRVEILPLVRERSTTTLISRIRSAPAAGSRAASIGPAAPLAYPLSARLT